MKMCKGASSQTKKQIKNVFELDEWKLAVIYDNINGGQTERDLFGFYRNQDRILVDASFTY